MWILWQKETFLQILNTYFRISYQNTYFRISTFLSMQNCGALLTVRWRFADIRWKGLKNWTKKYNAWLFLMKIVIHQQVKNGYKVTHNLTLAECFISRVKQQSTNRWLPESHPPLYKVVCELCHRNKTFPEIPEFTK